MRARLAAMAAALLACAVPAAAQAPQANEQAGWQKTVDDANAEGSLILYSQPNQDARDFILREFPKAYPKVAISLSVLDTPEFVTRIRTERAAGKYLWDVAVAGPPSGIILSHDGILDPVLPEILDPETKNPDLWGGWHDAFLDKAGTYVFGAQRFIAGPWYNALKIPPEKVAAQGLHLLLDPGLKGKIVWHDPVLPGSGTSYAYLIRVKLGDDAFKRLMLDQGVTFVPQQFQVVDAVARGTAWIGIGPPVRSLIGPYTKAGVKTDIRSFGNSPDNNLEAAGAALFLFKNRPHPNATRVFINWFLSKDVQYGFAKATDQASRRRDVPITSLPDETPIPGATYVQPQREEVAPAVQQTVQFINELRKSAK
ncbi:MAG TPA: extracellular solute-binding protein [Stellaceae bacterium]|nr:extracellular solute-binding protein [Stellaceae bacterium]